MGIILKVNAKRMLIDKANATMLLLIGVTAFIITFTIVGSKVLISQSSYQSRVIKEKNITLKQLKENSTNVNSLKESYKSFAEEKVNILDGNPNGTGLRDGDNPKIVLDALPSKYDFPGLISSLEVLLKSRGYSVESIGGLDDEVAQQNATSDRPSPIEIPFPLSVSTNYEGAQNLLTILERTIRPITINQMSVTAISTQLRITINAKTYYQPEKTLKITTKVVK